MQVQIAIVYSCGGEKPTAPPRMSDKTELAAVTHLRRFTGWLSPNYNNFTLNF